MHAPSAKLTETTIGWPALNNGYRPDIDGLRAFAVLSVVFYHAFPKEFHGGYVGVDIFFVISGFLISSILLRELSENRFSFIEFYGRRIRRLFPALAICLTAVLAYGFVCLLPSELMQLGKHVFFGAVFLSNIAGWSEAGYFSIAATLRPLLHLWSLGIEEQFYILWPALLWLIFRIEASGRLVVVFFLISFSLNILLSNYNATDDFFLPVSRCWELLAGVGLAWQSEIILSPKARSWISWGGLTALVISVVLFTPDLRYPGWPALLPVAGAVALIMAGPKAAVNRTILSNRFIVFVGLISYPFYLWHWPLISYAYVIRLGKMPTPLMAAGLVTVSFLLAWATYRFIEYPVRSGSQRHLHTQIAAACVAVLGLTGLVVWIENGFPERFPALPGLDMRKISEASLDPAFRPTNGMVELKFDGTSSDEVLVTQLGRGDHKVALAGDSLVFQFGPRVQQLADEGRLKSNTYFVAGGSCAPVPGIIQRDGFSHCAKLPGILTELIRREKIQSVVIGASWAGYGGESILIERDGRHLSLATQDGKEAFYANLKDYVRLLQSLGTKVYLVLGVPVNGTRFNPSRMVMRNLLGFRIAPNVEDDVPIKELRAIYAMADNRLRDVAETTGSTLLDAFPNVCGTGDGCSPFFDAAEPKYSDGMHLRPAFVRTHVHFLDFLLK